MKIEIRDMETGEVTVHEIPDDHPMAVALNSLERKELVKEEGDDEHVA